jgi:hypothetical protein
MPTANQNDEEDFSAMSQIPRDVADRIDRLFAESRRAAQRDDSIGNQQTYPTFSPPGDSLQPEGEFTPLRTDVHVPLTPSLARSTCGLCGKEKVSRWFRGIVFDEKTYCEPCHYKEAGGLTIQSAMAVPLR